jgi:hypothetical protein
MTAPLLTLRSAPSGPLFEGVNDGDTLLWDAAHRKWTVGPGGGGGAVDSVFGRTGNVLAETGDYDSDQITNVSSVAGASVTDALDTLQGATDNARGLFLFFAQPSPATLDPGDFLGPLGLPAHTAEVRCQVPAAIAHTVTRLVAMTDQSGGAVSTATFAVRVNGVQVETLDIDTGDQVATKTVSIALSEGDLVSVQLPVFGDGAVGYSMGLY